MWTKARYNNRTWPWTNSRNKCLTMMTRSKRPNNQRCMYRWQILHMKALEATHPKTTLRWRDTTSNNNNRWHHHTMSWKVLVAFKTSNNKWWWCNRIRVLDKDSQDNHPLMYLWRKVTLLAMESPWQWQTLTKLCQAILDSVKHLRKTSNSNWCNNFRRNHKDKICTLLNSSNNYSSNSC